MRHLPLVLHSQRVRRWRSPPRRLAPRRSLLPQPVPRRQPPPVPAPRRRAPPRLAPRRPPLPFFIGPCRGGIRLLLFFGPCRGGRHFLLLSLGPGRHLPASATASAFQHQDAATPPPLPPPATSTTGCGSGLRWRPHSIPPHFPQAAAASRPGGLQPHCLAANSPPPLEHLHQWSQKSYCRNVAPFWLLAYW